MKKLIAGFGLVVAGVLGVAQGVSAHTPNVSHNCAKVQWQFTSYEHARATVTVDGVVVDQKEDFSNWSGSYSWDQTMNHSYTIVIDDVGTQWDKTWSNTQQACQQPSTTSSSSTTSTTTSTTSTTVLETTTTQAPTTTVESTTTSVEASTTSSTVPASTSAPTSSTTTTSTVALGPPPTPPSGLPATGAETTVPAIAGILLVLGGVGAILVARRRHAAS